MSKVRAPGGEGVASPLIRPLLTGNPQLCLDEFQRLRKRDPKRAQQLRHLLLELPVLGSSERFLRRWRDLGLRGTPEVTDVRHVFPVVGIDLPRRGFVVPVGIEEAPQWHLSDAFGRFRFRDAGSDTPAAGDPMKGFAALLRLVESTWQRLHGGDPLPLRWRRSFSFRVLSPLHLDTIDGDSLQMPFLVAVLRALGEIPVTASTAARLPFGNGPVFSTGTLRADGTFGDVGGLTLKLRAFVREFGPGTPAILTDGQVARLQRSRAGKTLLGLVQPHRANTVADVLSIPELAQGLRRLSAPPHLTEIDGLLAEMTRLSRGVRFGDVSQVCAWLLPKMNSPCYRFDLLCTTGVTLCHKGRFAEAHPFLKEAAAVLTKNAGRFGVAARIRLAAYWGVLAVDAVDPSLARPFLVGLVRNLKHASEVDRVRYWGTLCQLKRVEGRLDEAVDAGRRAVECADRALAAESGRDRNYLVHALIWRAKTGNDRRRDLDEASRVLRASSGEWAPMGNASARQAHLGFCLHYEAEIARLRGRRFIPPEKPPWTGDWGHPWMFVLLACARNQAHSCAERIVFAERLLALVGEFPPKTETPLLDGSAFGLIRGVYLVYHAHLAGLPVDTRCSALEAWCQAKARQGLPGWNRRLVPLLAQLRRGEAAAAEAVCDAVPFH